MSSSRRQKIERVFLAARELSPGARSEFVSENCREDSTLKIEVEKLLADYDASFDSSQPFYMPTETDEPLPQADKPDPEPNRRIGVYELKKEIGRGGMGAVFLAERADGEFRQRVAVKLIKRGMDTDFIVRRFRNERQILATLDHPNIARLLDGGTTDDGLPYFVMEFIEGEPIHRYCDAGKLNLRERLRIFRQVCSALRYAHERQIVHRDIKPGNILVTKDGTPKLLDFGIAKILDPDLIHESVNPTSTMMRLMTLEYASPEQMSGGEITAASDIYALGVLLYEVVTGHRPHNFAGRALHEVSRMVCEETPIPPSRAVFKPENLLPAYSASGMTAAQAAEMRGATIDELARELGAGLDDVILKSLAKKPAQRYSSVKEMLDDISRFLDGKSVLAEPHPSARNVFESNHTDSSVSLGNRSIAVLPLKLLSVGGSEETGDRFLGVGLADALVTRLSNVRRFIVRPTSSVLRFGEGHFDPFRAGRELGVEYILDGNIQKIGERIRVSTQLLNVAEQSTVWAERFDEKFTDVLSLEDAISTKVAEALIPRLSIDDRVNLSKRGTDVPEAFEAYLRGRYHWNTFTEEGFAKAIVAYHEAVAADPNYALAHAGIADYYNWLGVYGVLPPRECFAAAKDAAEKAVSLDDTLAEAHAALGFALVGGYYDWRRGESECRRALELNSNNSTGHVWYSLQLFMEGRFEDGLRHARRGLELDPLTAFNRHNLGWGLYYARHFEESVAEYQKLIAEHPQYPLGFYGLAWNYRYLDKHAEAIENIKRALELNPDSAFMLTAYGQTLAAAGRREEAEGVLAKLAALAKSRHVSPYHEAIIHLYLGDKEKALDKLEESFENREPWIVWMGVEPALDSLRTEARFVNIFERTGNPLLYSTRTIVLGESTTASQNLTQAFDSSPESSIFVAKSDEAARQGFRNKKAVFAALAFSALAIGGFFAVRYGLNEQRAPEILANKPGVNNGILSSSKNENYRSLAVLPFVTVNAATDDEQYLGVGTADLVTSKLTQLNNINLRSASTVRRYLKTTKSPTEIGRELAVDYVVAGSVERAGGRVVARLEMTNVGSSRVIWSETFDEPDTSLLALQDSISERIASALSLQLTNAEKQILAKHFTESEEAQQLYQAGRYHFGKRTVEGLQQAIVMFERAIAIDPKFALAYTGISDCQALLNWYQEPPPPDAWEKAGQAAEKAVALDETLAESHASLAFVNFHYRRDYTRAENEFRRAINLRPNYATAHQWYAFFLSAQARHDEAIAVMRHAESLEPRSAVIANAVANVLFHARRYPEAIAQAKKALEIDPGSVGAHVILRWSYEKLGMNQETLDVFEKEIAFAGDTPTSRAKRAHVYAAVGKKDEARRILDALFKNKEISQITPYEIAVIYALLGDRDQSIEWLKRAKAGHAVGFSFVRVDPHLETLYGDPRFESLLSQ